MRMRMIALTIILSSVLLAQTAPVTELHQAEPRSWALLNATVHVEPGNTLENAIILIRDGKIVDAGRNLTPDKDYTRIDLKGAHVYAGFIESWLPVPASKSSPSVRDSWNEKIHAQHSALDAYKVVPKQLEQLHKSGFTTAHLVPKDGIYRGSTAMVQLNPQAEVLHTSIAQSVDFAYGGWESDEYPNALLGTIALIRQTLADGEWYLEAQRIARSNRDQNDLVKVDDALSAVGQARKSDLPFLFQSRDEIGTLQAIAIAEEFDLRLWTLGNGYEYRRVEALAQDIEFMILPIDFPAKPIVADPFDAMRYMTEELKHWYQASLNPAILVEARIPFALSSNGHKKSSDFRDHLLESLQSGFSAERALAALTTIPAENLGLQGQVGKIKRGYFANLVVTNEDYFKEDSDVLSVWISGQRHHVNRPPLVDARGEWELSAEELKADLILKKTSWGYRGKLKSGEVTVKLDNLLLEDTHIHFTAVGDSLGIPGILRFRGQMQDYRIGGTYLDTQENQHPWTASREEAVSTGMGSSEEAGQKKSLPVVYPDGAFGIERTPPQAGSILVQNATIWTSGPQGVLEKADLLVEKGIIKQVGRSLTAPSSETIVIDAAGKHLTPGIIDCHSHTAALSINEGTQSNTAEVRISDVLDPDDINIYRQLAGGVTLINILHGSANVIGGQNAVIKMKWGGLHEDLLYDNAPQGIKFALGENVKQSNWGDDMTTRYPQTRLGVEQWLRDQFTAAEDYREEWEKYRKQSRLFRKKVPPRRILEMEALVEILEGKRWIHCHSYRQDEILMLTRVAEDFGFTIGTFQHVLEGYKVADRIAEHGAGASSFSDWWAYKYEVIDAIPYSGTLMHDVGVSVSFNSDSDELARWLNTEAAKAVKYGGMSEEDALDLVTINPAQQLKVDKWVGSLEVGKEADFAIWSHHPLSTMAVCEQTWIEGRQYFSLERDRELQQRDEALRQDLIQQILRDTDDEWEDRHKEEKEPYSCMDEFEGIGGAE